MSMMIFALALSQAAPVPVGFQDFIIGQTREAAKAVAMPSDKYGPKVLRCSDDPDKPRTLAISPAKARAGLVKCRPYQQIGGSDAAAGLNITPEKSADVELWFHQNRLYAIDLTADFTVARFVENGLREKYGEADIAAPDVATTRMGVAVEQTRFEWRKGGKTIRMVAPDLTIERMTVIYYDDLVFDRAQSLVDGATKAAM